MNVLRDILLKRVRKWIQFADEDLRLAEHALKLSSGCPYRLIAYHAQQCAEKYIKAFLVFHEIEFPYTHNLRKLLQLCGEKLRQELEDADTLTPFAVTTRYPGIDEEVSKFEALSAIKIAKIVKKQILEKLSEKNFEM